MRHERGEGEGEGLPNEDGLLSPALSSIVPLEEREQAPFAFNEELCLATVRGGPNYYTLNKSRLTAKLLRKLNLSSHPQVSTL